MSPTFPTKMSAKPASTGRVSQFRAKNPGKVQLYRMKETVKKTEKRLMDDKYNEDIKTKEREKKRRQRAAKKCKANDKSKESSSSSAPLSSPMMSTPSSVPMVSPIPEEQTSTPSQMDTTTTSGTSSSSNRRMIVKFPFNSKTRKSPPNKNSDGFEMSDLSSSELMDTSSESSFLNEATYNFPTSILSSTPSRNPLQDRTNQQTLSRQKIQGQQIRKENNKVKSSEIAELKAALALANKDNHEKDIRISDLLAEVRKLKDSQADIKTKLKDGDAWIKPTYNNLSPAGRTELKTAVFMARDDFPVGTLSRLRENTSINFSKSPIAMNEEESELKKSVTSFAVENSCEVPDTRAARKGLRYFYNYKFVLWIQYKSNQGSDLSYSTFCKYWPTYIQKPKIEDFGTCKCQVCENVELLVSGMKRGGFLSRDHVVELMIQNTREGDNELESNFHDDLEEMKVGDSKEKTVCFLQWEKINLGVQNGQNRDVVHRIQKSLSCKEAAAKLESMYKGLKDHLERNFIIKTTLRTRREIVMESEDMAYIHIDWAENIEIQVPGEIQSAYFSHQSISIHTGYLYSRQDSGGFVSLSDSSCHKAEAIHAALKPTIEKLVAAGIKHMVFVSDSPTSQYRNNKNVFLTKKLAVKYNLSIEWIFTEAGHGKSCCDGVGGNIKTLIKDLTVFNTSMVISSASDIKDLIANKTTIEVTCHNQEDIHEVLNDLPTLSSLKGAMKMHQIIFDASGAVRARSLPTDPTSNPVVLKVLRDKPTRDDTEEGDTEERTG